MVEKLEGKRVLVSGASGFIGASLCSKLIENGAVVVGLSRKLQTSDRMEWLKCDVTDEASVRAAVFQAKPELIYHLASEVTGARDRDCVVPLFHANLSSTVYLMTAAADAGVERFIQTGSQEEPDGGNGEMTPTSPYAAAKWASSAYARMFHSLYDFGVVNLRVFMVYGPAQKDLRKLIPYCILQSLAGSPPKIGVGTRKVDWVYVADVVHAMLLAGTVPNIEGQTFEIGTGLLTSIREVVEKLVRFANPAVTAEFSTESRKMEIEYAADLRLAKSVLNWTPSVHLDEGLKRTAEWYAVNAKAEC